MKSRILNNLALANKALKVDVIVKDLELSYVKQTSYFPLECEKACQSCLNYGKLWTCPPFEDKVLNDRNSILLVVTRINFEDNQSDSEKSDIFNLVKRIIHDELLKSEVMMGGTALSFAGSCDFCDTRQCNRSLGKACRHPEKARRSLEGIGFDVGKLLKHHFGIELHWSVDGKFPDIMTFVAAILHNNWKNQLRKHDDDFAD